MRFDRRSLLFWPALPVIAAQGLWLRRQATRASEASGPRNGVIGQGPPLRVLALGDSIIAGVGIAQINDALPGQFARALAAASGRAVHWQAVGANGATAADSRQRLHDLRAALPSCDLVLLSTGVNDCTRLRRRAAFGADLHALRTQLRSSAPGCRLLLAAVPPLDAFPLLPSPLRQLLGMRARQLDAVMASVAADRLDALHVAMPFRPQPDGFGSDGFHPNRDACAVWAAWLVEHALRRWPALAAPAPRPGLYR